MYELFTTPTVLLSIVGGAVGGLKSLYNAKENGDNPHFSEVMVDLAISIIASISASTYFLDNTPAGPFAYLGVGLIAGFLGAYALGLLQTILPTVLQSFLKKYLNINVSKTDE